MFLAFLICFMFVITTDFRKELNYVEEGKQVCSVVNF